MVKPISEIQFRAGRETAARSLAKPTAGTELIIVTKSGIEVVVPDQERAIRNIMRALS